MYLVVSTWEVIPGHEDAAKETGSQMRGMLRSLAGVEFMEGFESGGKVIVVHGYTDEATYNGIINNPDGEFARAAEENKIEDHLRWLGSERGNTVG